MLLLNYQFNSKQVYILSGTLGNLIFFFRNHFGHFIGWLVPGTCFPKIAFFSKISVLLVGGPDSTLDPVCQSFIVSVSQDYRMTSSPF